MTSPQRELNLSQQHLTLSNQETDINIQNQSSGTSAPTPLSNIPSTRQRAHQPVSNAQQGSATAPIQQAPASTQPTPEELKFYMKQIYKIVQPVICCIILSVLWVKISLMGSDFRPQSPAITIYEQQSGDSSGTVFLGSLTNALIFIGTIIGATVLFVILFKYGCHKFLYLYLFLTVIVLLGFMGYLVLLNIIQVFNIPIDYITLIFGLYNFACAGLMVIFWRGPLYIQQGYLVVMSSLMAFALNGFEEYTTWIVLAALAIWDLIAVLCPFGPLKILIDSSREQNREIPALLYSVGMIWIAGMAYPGENNSEKLEMNTDVTSPIEPNRPDPSHDLLTSPVSSSVVSTRERNMLRNESANSASNNSETGLIQPSTRKRSKAPSQHGQRVIEQAVEDPRRTDGEDEDEEDSERNGLKLGLGDFIFYSVLISRTAMQDWVTTVACFVAVLTGLNATIFLLAIKRKALPALPISIAFGLLFYFLGSLILKPYTDTLSYAGVFI